MFKNEGAQFSHKNRVKLHSKRISTTHSSFGHRTDSLKHQKRIHLMLKDYDYVPGRSSINKRSSVDTRKIISIYENNESLRSIADVLNVTRKMN